MINLIFPITIDNPENRKFFEETKKEAMERRRRLAEGPGVYVESSKKAQEGSKTIAYCFAWETLAGGFPLHNVQRWQTSRQPAIYLSHHSLKIKISENRNAILRKMHHCAVTLPSACRT